MQASFLDEVGELNEAPDRISMVLLNRAPYRAALEGYYEFLRSVWVRLEEPALETSLERLPYLYEVWGTLHILSALLTVGAELGFEQRGDQQIVARDADGAYVQLMPKGRVAIELYHPLRAITVQLIPQRTFRSSGPIRSVSLTQVPDVTVELRAPDGSVELYVFDPKYKLESDQSEGLLKLGPKKEDIDKMHAYRDALRGPANSRVVRYAAILYPGPGVAYSMETGVVELAAMSADPASPEVFEDSLRDIFKSALA
jgi:predicted component of viral defense system (DUF524 family)